MPSSAIYFATPPWRKAWSKTRRVVLSTTTTLLRDSLCSGFAGMRAMCHLLAAGILAAAGSGLTESWLDSSICANVCSMSRCRSKMHSCLNVLLASLQHRFHSIHSSFLCELVASVRRLLGCWMRSQICLLHKYRLVPEGKAETGSVHWQARQKRRLSKSGTGESFGCNRWLAWVPIVAVRVDILLGVRGSVYIYFSMLPGHTRHGRKRCGFSLA